MLGGGVKSAERRTSYVCRRAEKCLLRSDFIFFPAPLIRCSAMRRSLLGEAKVIWLRPGHERTGQFTTRDDGRTIASTSG